MGVYHVQAGVCQGVLLDLVNMRVTARHPEASEYRPPGQPDAPIPSNSIDIHVHIRNDTYGLAMVGLHTNISRHPVQVSFVS